MADELASAGYPALRFDYPGTGDSLEAESSELWSVWQSSIGIASDWLRETTGVQRLVFIGLRLGATLAALQAACRTDVAGVVLLEPILRGRSFATQFTVEARLRSMGDVSMDAVEVNELRLTRETLALAAQTDLRRLTLTQLEHAAFFSQTETPLLSECAQVWRQQGVEVTSHELAGLNVLLRPSHLSAETFDATTILSWLRTSAPPGSMKVHSGAKVPVPALLRPAQCVENPLWFGKSGRLFGMLCRPLDSKPDRVVLIVNTGGDPHYGFARFSVELARRLAAAGLASLRIDFAGLGDSAAQPTDAEATNHLFTVDRKPDIVAALDELQNRGYRRFVLHGLCSGAYHALHGGLADARIDTLLLANLPFFTTRLDRPGPDSLTRRSLAELSRRSVRTLLLFSENDPGVRMLEQQFGAGLQELSPPLARVEVVPGLDHDLTGSLMRLKAAERMMEFLWSSESAWRIAAE